MTAQSTFISHGLVLDVNKGEYVCYICDRNVFVESAIRHIELNHHLAALNKFGAHFITENVPPHVKCRACNSQLEWPQVKDHAKMHNIIPWSKPSDIYQQYYYNLILQQQYLLYCTLCKESLTPCSWDTALNHIQKSSHVEKLKLNGSIPMPDWSPEVYTIVVSNGILRTTEPYMYFCEFCQCKVSGYNNIFVHINGLNHTVKRDKFKLECTPVNNSNCELVIPKNLECIVKELNIQVHPNKLYCPSCNVNMTNNSAVEGHLSRHLRLKAAAEKAAAQEAAAAKKAAAVKPTPEKATPEKAAVKKAVKDVKANNVKQQTKPQEPIVNGMQKVTKPQTGPSTSVSLDNLSNSSNYCKLKIPETYKWMIEAHNVQVTLEALYCKTCKVSMTNDSAVESHLQTHLRKKKFPAFIPPEKETPKLVNSEGLTNGLNTRKEIQSNSLVGAVAKLSLEKEQAEPNQILPESPSNSDEGPIKDDTSPEKSPTDISNYIFDINPEKIRKITTSAHLSVFLNDQSIYCLVCGKKVSGKVQEYYEHLCSTSHLTNLKEMEEDDQKFQDNRNELSSLSLARECMQDETHELTRCLLCNLKISSDDATLRQHLTTTSHRTRYEKWKNVCEKLANTICVQIQSSWYSVHKFRCDPCGVDFASERQFELHLKDSLHETILNQKKLNRLTMAFDFCPPCGVVWYGHQDSYAEHCEDVVHKYMVVYGFSATDKLPSQAVKFLLSLEENLGELIALSDKVAVHGRKQENDLLKSLEQEVKVCFALAKAYPFGSRISDLGFPDSDIDVFLDCGNMYDGQNPLQFVCQNLIQLVDYFLKRNGSIWKVREVLLNSRTPIIKAWHAPTRLHCDISFTNGLGVENTKMIKRFNETCPTCRKLILFLKRWLSFCGLLGSQFITSYALTWCVIFYLQNISILPSIAELIRLKSKSRLISGWETGVSYDFLPKQPTTSFKQLLLGFFMFYAEFDYRCNVVCPLLGRVIKKEEFLDVSCLPKEMAPYIEYIEKTKKPKPFCVAPMCVQDPFDLSHNLTKAIKKNVLNDFRIYCGKSIEVLQEAC